MFKKTAAYLTKMGLLLVEFFLQALQELSLKSVYLFNVSIDGSNLLFSKHVCPLTALFDVTLRKTE